MDFQNIIYIVGGAIYLLYSANKGLKEQKANRPQKNQPKPKSGWQNEMEEMLKKVMDVKEEPKPVVKKPPAPVQKKVEKPIHKHEDDFLETERNVYLQNKKQADFLHQQSEAYSVEFDDTPLSDHVTLADMAREPDPVSVGSELIYGEGFDARKAFVYSEIFKRRGTRKP